MTGKIRSTVEMEGRGGVSRFVRNAAKELDAFSREVKDASKASGELAKKRGPVEAFLSNFTGGIGGLAVGLNQGVELVQRFAGAVVDSLKELEEMAIRVNTAHYQIEALRGSVEGFDAVVAEARLRTGGLVPEASIRKAIATMDAFGLSVDQVPRLLEAASKASVRLGEDADRMVDSLITGVVRGSPQLLDNIGLVTSQLGDMSDKAGVLERALGQLEEQNRGLVTPMSDLADELRKTSERSAELNERQVEWLKTNNDLTDATGAFVVQVFRMTGQVNAARDAQNALEGTLQKTLDKTLLYGKKLDELFAKQMANAAATRAQALAQNFLSSALSGGVKEEDEFLKKQRQLAEAGAKAAAQRFGRRGSGSSSKTSKKPKNEEDGFGTGSPLRDWFILNGLDPDDPFGELREQAETTSDSLEEMRELTAMAMADAGFAIREVQDFVHFEETGTFLDEQTKKALSFGEAMRASAGMVSAAGGEMANSLADVAVALEGVLGGENASTKLAAMAGVFDAAKDMGIISAKQAAFAQGMLALIMGGIAMATPGDQGRGIALLTLAATAFAFAGRSGGGGGGRSSRSGGGGGGRSVTSPTRSREMVAITQIFHFNGIAATKQEVGAALKSGLNAADRGGFDGRPP